MLLVLLTIISCKKELQLADNDTYDVGIAVPLGHASLSIDNLISDTSEYINIANSGVINFSYRTDSIAGFEIADFFTIPAQEPQSQVFKVGILELDNFGPIEASASLAEMLEAVDTSMASYITSLDGNFSNLPVLQSVDSKSFIFSDFDDFEYVTFSEGNITLSITNNLPVTCASVNVLLQTLNSDSTAFDLGNFTFTNIGAGQTQQSSIPLNGLTLYNIFKITLVEYNTVETTSPVLVELANGLDFTINSNNLKVVGGKAKLPDQALNSLTDTTDLSFEAVEQLQLLRLNNASINYSIASFINIPANLMVTFPTANINGSPVSFSIDASNQSSGVLDLSGAEFDLTQGPVDPFNYLPIEINFAMGGSTTWIEFDSSSTLSFEFELQDLEFDLVKGWLGYKEITIDQEQIDLGLEALDQLSGTIALDDPKIHIIVDNNIGIPFAFNIDLEGVNADGNSQSLNSDPIALPYPLLVGDSIDGEKVTISNNNSQLSDFLANVPTNLNIGGAVITNPDSVNTGIVYSNFVSNEGKVQLGLEIETPFALSIDQLAFTDTINIDISEDDVADATYAHLSILTTNGIPFEADAQLHFVDSMTWQTMETITIDILDPALVDANGEVTDATEKHTIIELNKEQITNVARANKIIFTATVNTTNSASQTVTFFSDYMLDLKVGMLLRYDFEINND